MNFDERTFRNTLGSFPTGVAIVTGVTDQGERLGMTVSSFNAVSLAPPLVLFSLARRALSFAAWCRLRRYAVNVLAREQEALSNRFARSLGDKWSGVAVTQGQGGSPVFPNALAVFECEAYARYDGGDHDIFVGHVLALRVRPQQPREPLVFFDGRYRSIDSEHHGSWHAGVGIFAGW